jgi:predicted ATPase
MHVKQIKLREFRRFTDLTLEVPGRPQLVVLAGPNGTGKSSLLDALKFWNEYIGGAGMHGPLDSQYLYKGGRPPVADWFAGVAVSFHEDGEEVDHPRQRVYARTAYRNEPEFLLQEIRKVGAMLEERQPPRMIDNDERVSDNYQRMVGQGVNTLYRGDEDELTVRQVREQQIGALREAVRTVYPDLVLEGPGDPLEHGTFLFRKGIVSGFSYKNLSGGEKAVFDLLLDLLVKRESYSNTVFCIDEPEAHLNTAVQASLLDALLLHVNDRSQLWVASHSIGMMRRARDLQAADPDRVVFLDFSDHDFDQPVRLTSVRVSRAFWERTLSVALGDLSELVAPRQVVLCEGSDGDGTRARRSFDAACLRTIFEEAMPDAAFVPVGNDHEVVRDRLGLGGAIQALVKGATVVPLVDRDHRSPQQVVELKADGVRVLGRRNLEAYLLDDEVLTALCAHAGKPHLAADVLRSKQQRIDECVASGKDRDDLKSVAGRLYVDVRKLLGLSGSGSTADAFLRDTLAPLIRPGMAVYEELRADVFG